jgi:uncharacterized coiled-coil DUF342 family protein
MTNWVELLSRCTLGQMMKYFGEDLQNVHEINLLQEQLNELQDQLRKAKDQNFRRNKLVDNLRREIEGLKKKLNNITPRFNALYDWAIKKSTPKEINEICKI